MSQKKNIREEGVTVSPYEVGKGKPPKSGQIKPKEVRNPKGRPKKPKIGDRDLSHFLNERVVVGPEDDRREFTKRELMYRLLADRAAGGELRAIKVVLDHDRQAGAGESSDPLLFDAQLTEELLREMRGNLSNDDGPASRTGDTRAASGKGSGKGEGQE